VRVALKQDGREIVRVAVKQDGKSLEFAGPWCDAVKQTTRSFCKIVNKWWSCDDRFVDI